MNETINRILCYIDHTHLIILSIKFGLQGTTIWEFKEFVRGEVKIHNMYLYLRSMT